MNPKVKVEVDPLSLLAKVTFENPIFKVINELKLILNASSSNSTYNESGFTIPWHDFQNALVNIGKTLKKENVVLEFDDFSLTLVKSYLNDKKSLKSQDSFFEIDKGALIELLVQLGFDRVLKDEQVRDVLKLLKLKHGANFSVPGAGKTTTILAVHSILKHYGIVSKLIVVSPINAFISWEDEIREIFKKNPINIVRLKSEDIENFYSVIEKNPDVLLVNYEKLRRDISQIYPFFMENRIHLILDESHRIKSGVYNQSFNQIIKISDLAARRDILSGTPMPQSYLDLKPQFSFLWPSESIIPNVSNDIEENKVPEINSAIKNLYVRTTKSELNLKDPTIRYKTVPLGPIQKELYRLFKSEAARNLAGMEGNKKHSFRKIGKSVVRLLQAATNPMLLGIEVEYEGEVIPIPEGYEIWELLEEFIKYEKPEKIEYLKKRVSEILKENSNNKIVIWSYFVKNIQLLEKIFKEYNPVSIYGGVASGSDEDENNREGRIRKFHEDSTCRLMIANPQACGEGISLHKVCHYAIYLDRSFNAAHFLQSIDRIHRLGLDNKVETTIEILISAGTIDEILINRLNQKILAMGEVLNDKYLQTLAYDPADIAINDESGIDMQDFMEIKKHILNNEAE